MEPGRLLSALVEHSTDAFVMVDAQARILYVSPASRLQVGFEPAELAGVDPFSLVHPDEVPAMREMFGRVASEPNRVEHAELRMRHKDGGWRWLEATVQNLLHEPSVAAVIVVTRETGRQREAEAALRASEQRLRAVVTQAAIVLWAVDRDGVFTLSEGSGLEGLGLRPGQVVGQSAFQVYAAQPDVCALIRRALSGESVRTAVEVAGHCYDAWFGPLRDSRGAIEGATGVASDITETRRLQQQFLQAQKMEGLGRLAGGIAHDFNNLLTAVLGFAAILQKRHPAGDRDHGELEEIRKAADRAAGLTRQLLAFSRRQVVQPRAMDLNAVVEGARGLLARLIGEDVTLLTFHEAAAAWVLADPGQLEQVIVNLAVNARDAMPDGGRLAIATRRRELGPAEAQKEGVGAGCWVCLEVTDSGTGMSEEVQRRAFEPFFTTKEAGKGTGLGLATVYGIVTQAGGHVSLVSAPGRGTTFSIWLPETSPDETRAVPEAPRKDVGTETILVAEDEESVRDLCRAALAERGYRVLEAGSGAEALEVLNHAREPIHLLLADLVMPGMGGRELARRAQEIRPGIRALFVTGYAPDAPEEVPGHDSVVLKPFTLDELARKVRKALDGPPVMG